MMMRIVLMVHQATGTAMKVAKGYRSASWEIAFFMVLPYHFVEELCTAWKAEISAMIRHGMVNRMPEKE